MSVLKGAYQGGETAKIEKSKKSAVLPAHK
jgi:hypothetical protein